MIYAERWEREAESIAQMLRKNVPLIDWRVVLLDDSMQGKWLIVGEVIINGNRLSVSQVLLIDDYHTIQSMAIGGNVKEGIIIDRLIQVIAEDIRNWRPKSTD